MKKLKIEKLDESWKLKN